MQVVIGRIGRPRGIQGEVSIELRTDNPDGRLVPGAVFDTDRGTLVLESVRHDTKGWFGRFEQARDRTAVEELRGVELRAEESGSEPEAWYPYQLQGLKAMLPDGTQAGTVGGVEHFPGQDMLTIRQDHGGDALVPFVRQIVTDVDIDGGCVRLDPPRGLLQAWPIEGTEQS